MTSTREQVLEFVGRFATTKMIADSADLFFEAGIDGDDAFEFVDAFAAQFAVDISGYRWYFHHGEEGHNLGGLFFRPPYDRVDHIPVTLDLLIKAVELKRWPIVYPPHELPETRWDTRINLGCFVIALASLGLWAFFQFG
jgi:hypothetical protein